MVETTAVAYSLNLNSDAEVEDRVAGLKILAAFSVRPLDRQRCLEEILRVRSAQLNAQMRKPLSPETAALLNRVPASTSLGQAGDFIGAPHG